jgi:hypothetical protein
MAHRPGKNWYDGASTRKVSGPAERAAEGLRGGGRAQVVRAS